ncbi:MAG TPA: PadR family transcriptional regulator [Methanosarcina vacuolata]|uniref:PadR family transcriptional regulator n=1 Tax=Methanosarcina sp. Kolksee TaxID=1434099 RepID=UPI000615C137|nr:PadR family transcriptional regulator [Methanosarcina sp. Kolksee]AKB48046.1 Transcriptional regulator, PadR family [Methanosarcina sp. Kolksee]HPS88587.1 PadR family transcriptional regulator [Methanosarcina vacuolata]
MEESIENNKMCTEIRRAFLKYIVLKIIKEKPTHGYDIIKTVELRSNGRWTPSAGSIYPILEKLESKGFIQSEGIERRKVYTITPKGVKGLDRMTQEKLELLNEMSRIVNNVIEGDDNSDAKEEIDDTQDVMQQSKAAQDCDFQNQEDENNKNGR